jgi:F-type H+-transporting ATPase subunit epsilon
MAKTIQVDVVSAQENVFSGIAEFVVLPGEQGELGILPGHTPLISKIRPGTVRIKTEAGEELIFVAGGILEVQPRAVTVLADTAIRGVDLDEELLHQNATDVDYARAQSELLEAMAQLAAIRKFRGKR